MGRTVNQIARIAELPGRLPIFERSPEPHDHFLLPLCEMADVDWLVTGDKADLLTLGKHGRTRIVTASAFTTALDGFPPA